MPTKNNPPIADKSLDDVLAKIKQYENKGFNEAGAIHELIMKINPNLQPRLWYGMPGYAISKSGPVLCFFRKDKYITFGVTESANIDNLSNDMSAISSSWFITNLNEYSKNIITNAIIGILKTPTK